MLIIFLCYVFFFFFFKQKTAYEIMPSLVGSEMCIRDRLTHCNVLLGGNGYQIIVRDSVSARPRELIPVPYYCMEPFFDASGKLWYFCLLYTSDAADDLLCVDLGGRRIT